jgi:hypothetical protein
MKLFGLSVIVFVQLHHHLAHALPVLTHSHDPFVPVTPDKQPKSLQKRIEPFTMMALVGLGASVLTPIVTTLINKATESKKVEIPTTRNGGASELPEEPDDGDDEGDGEGEGEGKGEGEGEGEGKGEE